MGRKKKVYNKVIRQSITGAKITKAENEITILNFVDKFERGKSLAEMKKEALYIAQLMKEYNDEVGYDYFSKKNIEALQTCKSSIKIQSDIEGHKRLNSTYSCHSRFCPICNSIESKKAYVNIIKAIDSMMLDENDDIIIMSANLTKANCKVTDLKVEQKQIETSLRHMTDSMKYNKNNLSRLSGMSKMRKAYLGCYIAKEVSYNAKTNTFHPHTHVLFALKKSEVEKTGKITKTEFEAMWKFYLKVDYTPAISFRYHTAENLVDMAQSVAYFAQYISKGVDIDFTKLEKSKARELIGVLGEQLFRSRRTRMSDMFHKYVKFGIEEYKKYKKNKTTEMRVEKKVKELKISETLIKSSLAMASKLEVSKDTLGFMTLDNLKIVLNFIQTELTKEMNEGNFVNKRMSFNNDFVFGRIIIRMMQSVMYIIDDRKFVPVSERLYKYSSQNKEYEFCGEVDTGLVY